MREIYPWDSISLKQLNGEEHAVIHTVWEQMVDDLRMLVERGEVEVVAQQSRQGPLFRIPTRVWWLYRITDWESGDTNDSGSGDRLFGVFFRAVPARAGTAAGLEDGGSRKIDPPPVDDQSERPPRRRGAAEVAWMIDGLRAVYPDGDPVLKGRSRPEVLKKIQDRAGRRSGSLPSLDRARAAAWSIDEADDN